MRAWLAALWLLAAAPALGAERVELALVLANDGSASIDAEEYALQMQGMAAAFRDERVVEAIEHLGPGGLGVALLQWAGEEDAELALAWRVLHGAEDAARLADDLAAQPRIVRPGATALGDALAVSISLHLTAPFEARRRVIDVCGDGRPNVGQAPSPWRDAAWRQGIAINALAIENQDVGLAGYYERAIIAGPGAFVERAVDFVDFADAFRRKLLRELRGAPIAMKNGQ
ncbi:MAG: DUF1194 domain-containing protein [Alphaproteobacteria bacterium]